MTGTLRGRFGEVDVRDPGDPGGVGGEDREAGPVHAPGTAAPESRSSGGRRATASRTCTASNCSLRPRTRPFPTPKSFHSRSAPVHLQRRGRRAEDVDQRPALHPARRKLGLQRVHAALPRARVRRGRPLPPRHELHHDPQLGGPDRRRRILRSVRPLRHRGLAGLLARQSLGRPGPGRQRRCSCATRRTRSCGFAIIPPSASTAGATKAIRRSRSTTASGRLSPTSIPACTTSPVRPTMS